MAQPIRIRLKSALESTGFDRFVAVFSTLFRAYSFSSLFQLLSEPRSRFRLTGESAVAVARLMVLPHALPPPLPVSEGLLVRSYGLDGDPGLVRQLAAAVARDEKQPAGAGAAGPSPRASGLLAELASRPGRRVQAWLALETSAPSARPLGLVTLVNGGPATERRHSIAWLVVAPQSRRRGIGRRLVEAACQRAWQEAAPRVWVECHTDWHAAITFWQALGFRDQPLV